MEVQLPSLHDGQRRVWDEKHRFRVLACGRRWGKTRLGSLMCVDTALRGGRAWWVAPSYPVSAVGWRGIKHLATQIPGADVKHVDKIITMPGGGSVQVRSADNPDSLRGDGLDFVVMDECAFIKEAAWAEALRPALSDRKGKALFISTPKGRNWFWRMHQKEHDEQDPDRVHWKSWQFPTSDNPFIEQGEIDQAQRDLPERIFRQEYMAEFIDDAGGVFRGVMEAATAERQTKPLPMHTYIIGVDWGKHHDFTAIVVLDAGERQAVLVDRFNMIDYQIQIGRLRALCEMFQPVKVIAERNSMGEPLIEQLRREGLPVQPFTTTNASKQAMIDALTLAFERKDLTIVSDPALVSELQAFEATRLPSGMLRYSAPEGMHDDTVIALGLAWSGLAKWPRREARSFQG